MGPAELAVVGAVALLAGALNAVAGGGSLVLFPALLAVGLPPLAANVTNSVALWPGYVGTALGYREELRPEGRTLAGLAASALLGAGAGCALLLTTPAAAFDAVVPGLVLLASVLLALQAPVTRWVQRVPGSSGGTRSPLLHAGLFLAGAYGGYFGGGLGVVLTALLAVLLTGDLRRVNGLRAALSLLVNTVALAAFALFGPVDLLLAAVGAPAALVGGYAGARLARRLPVRALRTGTVALGVAVAVALFVRG